MSNLGWRAARAECARRPWHIRELFGALFTRAINLWLLVMPGRSRSPGRGRAGDIEYHKSRRMLHLCCSGEFYLGFPRADLQGVSWYRLLHWECTREAQTKHRLSKFAINTNNSKPSCVLFCSHPIGTGTLMYSLGSISATLRRLAVDALRVAS